MHNKNKEEWIEKKWDKKREWKIERTKLKKKQDNRTSVERKQKIGK